MNRILVTGGGTAGHTNPGIAVAESLVELGLEAEDVLFVGGERGNEGRLVGEAGFAIELLPGRGLLRSVSRRAIRQNVSSIADLLRGARQAFTIVRRFKPDAVLCLGGYAAFAATLASVVTRVPVVISEQNARASAVNRLFGRVAKVCALPYPDTDLPKGQLTGNPILRSVVDAVKSADKVSARQQLGLGSDGIVIAVWAGSLGARSINEAVAELVKNRADDDNLTIYHVIGRRDWERYRDGEISTHSELNSRSQPETKPESEKPGFRYHVVEYENRMPLLLAAADLAICRGGASTAAELAVAGLPSILIPLPTAPRDHQRANGKELVAAGGAVQIDDENLNGDSLWATVQTILGEPGKLNKMSSAAASVGRPEAAKAVAQILLQQAGVRLQGSRA